MKLWNQIKNLYRQLVNAYKLLVKNDPCAWPEQPLSSPALHFLQF